MNHDNLLASFLAFIALIFVGVFLFIGIPAYGLTYYTQRSHCHSFGAATNREVKFQVLVRVGIPIQWDCFAQGADGKWIPTKNLREFGDQP